ncbi:MAG TPA: hypothetical protein VKR53_03590 [Puia sp.]|nr:hypothetical protein [Puia sp.]
MKQNAIAFLIASIFLQSCFRFAYYVSPFDTNNNTYHAIPLRSDSVKSALLVSGSFFSGITNELGERDGIYDFRTNIYRTHNIGFFELYYGLDLTLGNYAVNKYDSFGNSHTVNYTIINKNAGSKFFGGVGLNGGFDFAIPLGKSEWRIGLEFSEQNEFGNYLKFRKELSDSAATFIARDPSFVTISWTSEFAFRTKYGSWGLKLASGKVLNGAYQQLNQSINQGSESFYNMSFAFQYTNKRFTGFIMESISPLTLSIQLGCIYQILKNKKIVRTILY